MQWAVRQILRCRFQGIPKRLFLEGKVLELLGLTTALEMTRQEKYCFPAQPYLLDRVHYARDILHQRLDNPPSLAELAQLVGLNECTLKREFRACFGKTVFKYLHDYRMDRAWQALIVGDWTVKEVARMVGYHNLAAFSRAFSKQFNINPRACLSKNSV
jgi:AraC-like DNA-binding protein